MWLVALQPCQGQPCDCFEHLLVINLSTWAEPLRKKKWRSCSQTWQKDYATAVLLGIPPKLIRAIVCFFHVVRCRTCKESSQSRRWAS